MSHSSQASRKPVPKFASFRPQDSPLAPSLYQRPADPKDEVGTPRSTVEKDENQGSKRHAPRTSSHVKREHHDHGHPTRQDHPIGRPQQPAVTGPQTLSPDFTMDTIGDPQSVIYGSLDRYQVPKYTRSGAGHVVGTGSGIKIDRNVSNEKGLILSWPHNSSDETKALLRNSHLKHPQELRILKGTGYRSEADYELDFMSLRPSKRRRTSDQSLAIYEKEHELGARNTALDKSSEDSEADSAGEPELGDGRALGDHDAATKHRQRIAALTLVVEKDPTNGIAWLELLDHQDGAVGFDATSAERRSNAEIKISIAKKALDQVLDATMQDRILLILMTEGRQVWESPRLINEWETVLRKHPASSALWMAYLDVIQTDAHLFKYESFQAACLKCLEILAQARSRSTTAAQSGNISQIQIFLILRITLSMRQAGYCELSMAIWQALLEFECFAPSIMQTSDYLPGGVKAKQKLCAFEDFWESQVLRLGEEGAQGWLSFQSSHDSAPEPATTSVSATRKGDIFESWLNAERETTILSGFPARTVDDNAENDPFRVVLFGDIRPFLAGNLDDNGRRTLFQAFLMYARLPLFSSEVVVRKWHETGIIKDELLPLHNREAGLPFDIGVSNFQVDAASLFVKPSSWFTVFAKANKAGASRQDDFSLWSLRALRMLVFSIYADDDLAEYFLALEATLAVDVARKTAQKLLKRRPSSLRLYNCYALIEFRSGNNGKGEQALIAALNMAVDSEQPRDFDRILLWRTWAWEIISRGNLDQAMQQLQTYGEKPIKSVSDGYKDPNLCHSSISRALRSKTVGSTMNHDSMGLT